MNLDPTVAALDLEVVKLDQVGAEHDFMTELDVVSGAMASAWCGTTRVRPAPRPS